LQGVDPKRKEILLRPDLLPSLSSRFLHDLPYELRQFVALQVQRPRAPVFLAIGLSPHPASLKPLISLLNLPLERLVRLTPLQTSLARPRKGCPFWQEDNELRWNLRVTRGKSVHLLEGGDEGRERVIGGGGLGRRDKESSRGGSVGAEDESVRDERREAEGVFERSWGGLFAVHL
jgi:hypothetical protein